jgi:hypothetical protein
MHGKVSLHHQEETRQVKNKLEKRKIAMIPKSYNVDLELAKQKFWTVCQRYVIGLIVQRDT